MDVDDATVSAVMRHLNRQRERVACTCVRCGAAFQSYAGTRWCSDRCRMQAVNDARRETRRLHQAAKRTRPA